MISSSALSVQFSSEKRDAKAAVVDVLSKEWPLTAREIFSRAGNGSNSFTYQAIHKALGELSESKVVSRVENSHYSLSFDWIDRLSRYSDELKASYSKAFAGVAAGQTILFFDSVAESDTFLVEFFASLADESDRILALQWCHFWIPLFLPRRTYVKARELIRACEAYSITPADTPVDKWCSKYWEKNGLNHRLGVKEAATTDVVVYKDVLAQVFYPMEFKRALDEVYSSVSADEFDFDKFYEKVFEKKRKVPVVITRNAQLADQLKLETIALWSGK